MATVAGSDLNHVVNDKLIVIIITVLVAIALAFALIATVPQRVNTSAVVAQAGWTALCAREFAPQNGVEAHALLVPASLVRSQGQCGKWLCGVIGLQLFVRNPGPTAVNVTIGDLGFTIEAGDSLDRPVKVANFPVQGDEYGVWQLALSVSGRVYVEIFVF